MAQGREVTRANLRRIKQDLSFAREGYDLLRQKRDILLIEIMRHVAFIRSAEEEFRTSLRFYYSRYRNAAVGMGRALTGVMADSEKSIGEIRTETRRFLGLNLPRLKYDTVLPEPPASFAGTTLGYDMTRIAGVTLVEHLLRYATLFRTVVILARELSQVQRQVNALEKIFIPEMEGAIRYVSDRLEEREREEIFIRRMMRDRQA